MDGKELVMIWPDPTPVLLCACERPLHDILPRKICHRNVTKIMSEPFGDECGIPWRQCHNRWDKDSLL